MLLDIHAHTSRHSSCSRIDPVGMIARGIDRQLQGIVLTEHQYQWTAEELAGLTKEAQIGQTFLLLAGQEVSTDIGHVLVFGASRTIDEKITLKGLRKCFPDAALVWAHPLRGGKVPRREELCDRLLDAVEIFSSNHTVAENVRALALWHEYKFTAVSGSDAHAADTVGIYPTLFDHSVATIADLVAELRAGRCRPFMKEVPKAGSNVIVTELTIGTKGQDETRPRYILRTFTNEKKWIRALQTVDLVRALYRQGFATGPFRVPQVIDVHEAERQIVEEGQRGKNLFDVLPAVGKEAGDRYLDLVAAWLARLHRMPQTIAPQAAERCLHREERKIAQYVETFVSADSPYAAKISAIAAVLLPRLGALCRAQESLFVRNHGDYHPKNIIIGHDRVHDTQTAYASVIDFDNAFDCVPLFDVGYFIAQFRAQFFGYPQLLKRYPPECFYAAYLRYNPPAGADAERVLALFRLRADLSIGAFLVKVGQGIGAQMDGLIADAERLLPLCEGVSGK